MSTLGERLKKANKDRAEFVSKTEVEKRNRDEFKFNLDNEKILNKLKEVVQKIEYLITNDKIVKGEKLPTDPPFNTYLWPNVTMVGKFEVKNHPHYSALQSFFDWADANDLVGQFEYQHDGVGIESWFVATVEPK